MYFLGIFVAVIFLIVPMLLAGSPMLFVSAPSILIVVGCSLALHIAAHGGRNTSAPFKFSVPGNLSSDDGKSRSRVISDFRQFLVVSGWIGFIIGIVLMLANVSDPDALGPGAAVALLTVFYGYFFSYFIYLPLQRRLEQA